MNDRYENSHVPGFRHVPRTGVINVMYQASQFGYKPNHPQWANLGQGSPDTGYIEGVDQQVNHIDIKPENLEYSPIPGIQSLREKIAEYYNYFFRKSQKSRYTFKNVCITPGGRSALTRIAACLGDINIGHFIPDYTAYEELLTIFRAFIPIPTPLQSKDNYQISYHKLKDEILSHGLSAVLLSNPRNPTGQLIESQQLDQWVKTAKKFNCNIIFDEFYSHYIYPSAPGTTKLVSAAEYVEDVNNDPVIIVDGLTKNWRLPGWRIGWILASEEVVEATASAGSFLDGGANHPLQYQALKLFDVETIATNVKNIQDHFRFKRDYMFKRLVDMGFGIDFKPKGTFYVWADLSNLAEPIMNGKDFLNACLKEKTIVVPGVFFDVNPGKRRNYSRWENYVRFSFGPNFDEIKRGLDAVERVVSSFK